MSIEGAARRLKLVIILSSSCGLLSFLYSFIGLASGQAAVHLHEYSLGGILTEISGHFLFGAVAAIPLLQIDLLLMAGSMAVLIDSDHILGALNLNAGSRPAHSILYAFFSAALLFYLTHRLRLEDRMKLKLTSLAPIALLSHLSYDVFVAFQNGGSRGGSFPLLTPLNFGLIPLSYLSWIVLEAVSIIASISVEVASRRFSLAGSKAKA